MSVKRPDPVDIEVGHRIRIERLARGLSQTALANQLGVTFQQVQKYEKGTNRIGASRLQQIAHILQVPVAFFFEDAPRQLERLDETRDAPSASYVSEFLASTEGLSLTRAFMRIDEPKLRRRIVDLVEAIAGGRKE